MTENKSTKSAPLFLGIFLIIAIMLSVTLYCGSLTGRWSTFRGLDESKEALQQLPWTIGDWEANPEKAGKLSKEDVNMLQIEDAYIVRRYKNTKTMAEVNLIMMVGPTGRVVVHTPEICFGGRDYEKEDAKIVVSFPVGNYMENDATDDMFWKLNFVNKSARGGTISFYYGVSAGGPWIASENPRSDFQRYRYAYKLQAEASVDGETDNVKQFLEDCLATIHEHMRPCQ